MRGRSSFRCDSVIRPRRHLCRYGFTLVEFLVVLGIIAMILVLVLPEMYCGDSRPTECRNNLKHIGLALHNYHDVYGGFPPAYTVDANGNPLHSWRTLILPYMDQQELYTKIDLSKPWDDPSNMRAAATVVPNYVCPSAELEQNQTAYLAVITSNSCLRPTESRSFSEVTDGSSNTVMVIEVPAQSAVPWMAPWDADARLVLSPKSDDDLHHTKVTYALFVDGSVQYLSSETETATLRSLISATGGETLEPDAY